MFMAAKRGGAQTGGPTDDPRLPHGREILLGLAQSPLTKRATLTLDDGNGNLSKGTFSTIPAC